MQDQRASGRGITDSYARPSFRCSCDHRTGSAYFASGQTLEKITLSSDSGKFRFSENEGFGKVEGCVNSKRGQELYMALQFQGSKHNDSDVMRHLIAAYTEEVESSPMYR